MPDKENLKHLGILYTKKESYPHAAGRERGYWQTSCSWQVCGNLHNLTPLPTYSKMYLIFLTYSELLGILTFLVRNAASKVDKKEKEARTGYIFCSLFKVWSQLAIQIPQNPWSWGPVANGVLGHPHIHVLGKWLLRVLSMPSLLPLHDESCDCCGFPLETSSCSQEGWEQFLGCSCRCTAG